MSILVNTIIGAHIPCPTCGKPSIIKLTKKNKPYYHCNDCMIQVFVRGKIGISKLMNLMMEIESRTANSTKKQALTVELLELQKQLDEIKSQEGIEEFFEEDTLLQTAKNKILEEMQKIESQIKDLNSEGEIQ